MTQLERLALDYAEEQLNGVGQPYSPRYRKQLINWWLRGFHGKAGRPAWTIRREGWPGRSTGNFDKPLETAWHAGAKRSELSKVVRAHA